MRAILVAVALTTGIAIAGINVASAVPVKGASLAQAAADTSPVFQVPCAWRHGRWSRRWRTCW